jgi:hypothetical protein
VSPLEIIVVARISNPNLRSRRTGMTMSGMIHTNHHDSRWRLEGTTVLLLGLAPDNGSLARCSEDDALDMVADQSCSASCRARGMVNKLLVEM